MALGEIIGAVGSLAGGAFGAMGDEQAASEYRKAARMEQANATFVAQDVPLVASNTWMKQMQQFHQMYGTIGMSISQQTGGNLKLAGSGRGIVNSSFRAGSFANGALATQGKAEMNDLMMKSFSMAQQAQMDQAMAKREDTAAMGSMVGGALGALGGIAKGFASNMASEDA